ncbi:hypothetical protein [Parasphingorhabdus pacifica]
MMRLATARFPWLWLLPSLGLLITMGTWGAMVYSDLPELIPKHIGPSGVDEWSRKSVGSVFVLPFVYVGITALFGGLALGIMRITPDSEVPYDRRPEMINRPASAASATRCAKAVLGLNTAIGVAFLLLCAVIWRTTHESAVPLWLLPTELGLILAGTVPLLVAGLRDRSEKRERTQ